jgi:hypothetical protein
MRAISNESFPIDRLVGLTVISVRRIEYVAKATVGSSGGPFELRFANGEAVTFDAGANGETLSSTMGIWDDPFAEPLSDENRAYVDEVGKWTPIDVTHTEPFARIVGIPILEARQIRNHECRLVGVEIIVEGIIALLRVGSDELSVIVTVP